MRPTPAATSRASCRRASPAQGEISRHRQGRRRGEASGFLSPLAFVNFLQNHDQIGNRPLGDRLVTQVDEAAARGGARRHAARSDAAAAVHGRGMGRHGSRFRSFAIFPSRWPQRSAKVAAQEFAAGLWRARRRHSRSARGGDVSLGRARLGGAFDSPPGQRRLALVRDLLAIRRREIAPHLSRSRVRIGAVRQARADGKLVAGRRTFARLAGQFVEHRRGPPPAIPIGATDLGR